MSPGLPDHIERRPKTGRILVIAACIVLLATGCADRRMAREDPQPSRDPLPHMSAQAHYKVGNPYEIAGIRYFPEEDYTYAETGIASWYGPKFHGRPTANGEVFDMNMVSAAHKTLPMPSVVRVTNLQNGRSLVVRVNDRGPFVAGRIIDLSRRTADLLDIRRQGTAPVRVEILPRESRHLKELALKNSLPPVPDTVEVARSDTFASDSAIPARETTDGDRPVPERNPQIFVQAGAFTEHGYAARALARLQDHGAARIAEGRVGERQYFRVRFGPLRDFASAESALQTVVSAGFPKAIIVVD